MHEQPVRVPKRRVIGPAFGAFSGHAKLKPEWILLLLAHHIEIKVLPLLTTIAVKLPVVKIVVVVLARAYTPVGVLSMTAFDD